jgi:hypothetical protein
MNHYDPFILDFIAEHKSASFEKIGHLIISGGDYSPGVRHEGNVTFQYDKRAETTPELSDFIAEQTGKNKMLIQSDLESHFELTRQFINIGKPYELEGIGFISLNKSGEYTFTPYETTEGKEEHKTAKKKQHIYTAPHTEQKRTSKSFLMFVAFLIIVGVLGVIGWGTYKLFVEKGITNINDTIAISNTAASLDTTSTAASLTDSTLNKDTTRAAKSDTTKTIKNDSSFYKFIFERTYSLQKASDRIDEVKIILSKDASFDSIKTDSTTLYRLFLRLKLPSADTAQMRDSLQRYFQHSIKIIPL